MSALLEDVQRDMQARLERLSREASRLQGEAKRRAMEEKAKVEVKQIL